MQIRQGLRADERMDRRMQRQYAYAMEGQGVKSKKYSFPFIFLLEFPSIPMKMPCGGNPLPIEILWKFPGKDTRNAIKPHPWVPEF